MEVYSLNSDFINEITTKIPSFRETNSILGFDIKHILYKNKTISKEKLVIIRDKLNITTTLELTAIDTTRNLKHYAEPRSITFPNYSTQLAEFVGIMLGDGNIYNDSIRIILNAKEENYKEYVCNLFRDLFGTELNRNFCVPSNTMFLVKTSKNLREFLLKIGLVSGDKVKNQVAVPDWILQNPDFAKSCLRGLIDTDGCMHFNKRDKQLRIGFKNHSLKLLENVVQIGQLLDIPFVKAGHNYKGIYRKEHIERYLKQVGSSNNKHLAKVWGYGVDFPKVI